MVASRACNACEIAPRGIDPRVFQRHPWCRRCSGPKRIDNEALRKLCKVILACYARDDIRSKLEEMAKEMALKAKRIYVELTREKAKTKRLGWMDCEAMKKALSQASSEAGWGPVTWGDRWSAKSLGIMVAPGLHGPGGTLDVGRDGEGASKHMTIAGHRVVVHLKLYIRCHYSAFTVISPEWWWLEGVVELAATPIDPEIADEVICVVRGKVEPGWAFFYDKLEVGVKVE